MLSGWLCPSSLHSAPTPWPRSFTAGGAEFRVYQPQVFSWQGATLSARVAVAVQEPGDSSPLWGTVTFDGTALTGGAGQAVALTGLKFRESVFSGAAAQAGEFGRTVAAQAPQWAGDLSRPAILADLAGRGTDLPPSVAVDNTPPQILFSGTDAVLVPVDGDPVLRPVQDTGLQRVLNTRALLVREGEAGPWYLRIRGAWLASPDFSGPWTAAGAPPEELQSLLDQAIKDPQTVLFEAPAGSEPPMPAVFVSTVPSEVIITAGPPSFIPLPGTDLLLAENANRPLFADTDRENFYLLLAGRWFRAPAPAGPWTFLPADRLPAGFSQIPESHPAGRVLASVAGTIQAREAVIAATIPHTARIARSATIDVNYAGGVPQFTEIAGTSLSYAVNTALPVLRTEKGTCFAAKDGVWFTAADPFGPWTVAAEIPETFNSIPPSSPVFPATAIRIFAADEDSVVTGYTPGYAGVWVAAEGVPVFGTGYTYAPFLGEDVWIGRPQTYGFGASFSAGLATGFVFSLGEDHLWTLPPWWEPWNGRAIAGAVHPDFYARWDGAVNLSRSLFPAAQGNPPRWTNPDPAVSRIDVATDSSRLGDNRAFAGSDGAVYRARVDGSWDRYAEGAWQDAGRGGMEEGYRVLESDRTSRAIGSYRETFRPAAGRR